MTSSPPTTNVLFQLPEKRPLHWASDYPNSPPQEEYFEIQVYGTFGWTSVYQTTDRDDKTLRGLLKYYRENRNKHTTRLVKQKVLANYA